MVAGKPEMLEGSAVRAQLVSRHRLRREALLAEQLAHELDGCAFIPSALNKDFREPRPHHRPRATGTYACRRSGRPSCRDASDCSATEFKAVIRDSRQETGREPRRC